MDRAGGFGRAVAADVAWEGELFEEAAQAGQVLAFVGVDLAVAAIEIGGRQHPRGAVAGPGEVDHVEAMAPDHPVGMGPEEGLPRT